MWLFIYYLYRRYFIQAGMKLREIAVKIPLPKCHPAAKALIFILHCYNVTGFVKGGWNF